VSRRRPNRIQLVLCVQNSQRFHLFSWRRTQIYLFLELLEQGLQNMERGPLVTGTPAFREKLADFYWRIVRNNRVEAFVSDLVDDRLIIHAAIRISTANHLHDEHTEGPCCDSRGGMSTNSQVSKQTDTDKGLPSEDLENSFCAIASGANHFWCATSSPFAN
jgi:hypothetical protein